MRALAAILPIVAAFGCGRCGGSSAPADTDAGAACRVEESHAGEGTYYDADGSGNCSFEASPGDLRVAAINSADYAGAAACGACAAVDGPDGSVTVRIVDRCPGCAAGDLDLSAEAFAEIAPLSAGRVAITWRYVPCPVSGSMRYHFKDGTSESWAAIQIRNHRHAVASLAARPPGGGAWQTLARADYDYFVADSGLGPGPLDLRITDVHDQVVEDPAIALGDAVERTGAAQLPVCE